MPTAHQSQDDPYSRLPLKFKSSGARYSGVPKNEERFALMVDPWRWLIMWFSCFFILGSAQSEALEVAGLATGGEDGERSAVTSSHKQASPMSASKQ